MKTELFFFFCCVVIQAKVKTISARAIAEEETSVYDTDAQCVKELRLDEERIRKLEEQEITPENNDQYNSYQECSWKKSKLQDNNGRIDYDALRKHLIDIATSELANAEEPFVSLIKQQTHTAVDYCQQNPPGGVNYGQIIVRLQNCIMKKLNEKV